MEEEDEHEAHPWEEGGIEEEGGHEGEHEAHSSHLNHANGPNPNHKLDPNLHPISLIQLQL